ncbi:MAG: CAP domain-containing protein [Planctomycetes bacterium]|nr:CAP domain-containing protein [Planctomycetota bacterium]
MRWQGITIHSRLPDETLERILRQALRAAALSRGLLLDDLALPKDLGKHEFVLLDTEAHFQPALDEARATQGLKPEEYQRVRELGMRSFVDARGWRTSRWRSEAEFEALVLWDMAWDWFGADAQPCLRVGHVNWVCLHFLGTSMPMLVWSDPVVNLEERSVTQRDEAFQRQALWRSARTSLWGCRAWMVRQARAKSDPPWVRALLDQDGKIRDENLLKTTLVCELLQQEGQLWPLVQATRGKKDIAPAIEQHLGETLPALEARWRGWLDPPPRVGVVQVLEQAAPAPEAESPFRAALLRLNHARADALKGQAPEIPVVALDAELSRAAELHAQYLSLNPAQKERWPDVHEERPDAPGFTPAGSLSGSRSVIAFDGDPDLAVASWLATFYHRLPLLDPGLFGVGFGRADEVVVLDAHSLVLAPWRDHVVRWPLPEAEGVPLRMRLESPNPVPGENMGNLGYPISLQLFFAEPETRVALTFELFRGAPGADHAVECHFITPSAPLQIELVPENAWGLIPKSPLAPSTLYTARATFDGRTEEWSFTTGK